MSMPIQRQSEAFNVFDDGDLRFARDHTSLDLPPGLASAISGGPRIHAGMNNPGNRRQAWGPGGENEFGPPGPLEPAWASHDDPESSYTGYSPEEQSYNDFGHDPHSHIPEGQVAEQPAYPGDGGAGFGFGGYDDYDPHSSENLDAHEQFSPHMASFTEARHKDDGPTPGKTAAAISPQVVPGWVGHGYVPGHRVVLPWREQLIPGVVTHLDGQQVGVRWDDGQHSSEEPADLRPR